MRTRVFADMHVNTRDLLRCEAAEESCATCAGGQFGSVRGVRMHGEAGLQWAKSPFSVIL